MKNSFISLLAVALGAAALFTSCEKEQSVFSPESLPGSCTVTGVITYDEGYAALEQGGIISSHKIPAVGQVAMLAINNNSYGVQNQGKQIYLDTLDAEGRYEFTIPAPANGETLTGEITVIPFKASHGIYQNNQLVILDSVLYENTAASNVTIQDQFPKEINITAYASTADDAVEYSVPVTINGSNVTAPGFDNTTSHNANTNTFFDANILITVGITDYNNPSNSSTILYNTQASAATGEYTATIYLPKDFFTSNNYSATITAESVKEVRDFVFWYQDASATTWNNATIDLLYKQTTIGSTTVNPSNNPEYEYLPIEFTATYAIQTTPVSPDSDLIINQNSAAASAFGWLY